MKHPLLSIPVLLFTAGMLSSCQNLMQSPFASNLPPGVVRGPDGTLMMSSEAPPQGLQASQQAAQGPAPKDNISYWSGDRGNGPARIRIVLSEQTAYFFRGDVLVGKSWLSTGDENHRTPTGSFRIIQKDKHHKSSRYGAFVDSMGNVIEGDVDNKKDPVPKGLHYEGASMTNFMRLTNEGVGMHAGFLPGYAASHGCIRMPEAMSEKFFDNVVLGTPVTVVP